MYFQADLTGGTALYQLVIEQIIDRAPLVVEPKTRLMDVLDQIDLEHRQSYEAHFPPDTSKPLQYLLVATEQQFLGIVTEQMLIKRIAEDYSLQSTTIAEVMVAPVAILPLHDPSTLIDIIERFCQTEFLCLPVVDQYNQLAGVVTPQRLLQVLNPMTLLKTIGTFQDQQIEKTAAMRATLDINQQLLQTQARHEYYTQQGKSLKQIAEQFENILKQESMNIESCNCLEHQESQFKSIVEKLTDGVARFNCQGHCLYANPAIARMVDLPQSALIGHSYTELNFPASLIQQWSNGWNRALKHQIAEKLEFCCRNGYQKQFYQAQLIPEQDATGTTIAVLMIVSDMTETRKIEQLLQESEERLQIALDMTSMGTWDWSPSTGQEIWSPETEALYGLEPGSFEGRVESFLERVHPDDRDMVHDFCVNMLDTSIQHKEFRIVLPDGQIRWIISRGRILHDKSGKPIRLIGIDLDITERKLAEESLQESQHQLEALMGHLPGIAYTCKDDQIWTPLFMSQGCFEVTGYSAQEMVSNSSLYHEIIHPDDVGIIWNTVKIAIQERRSYEVTYRIRTAQGEEKWVWEKGGGVFNEEGNLLFLAGFITDISARKQAEEKLKDSLQEKEVLLREIHHRVKNNLQMVSSLLNLQAGAIKNPQVVAALKESEKRVATMALIHERLYQTDNLAKIDFREYAYNLIESLVRSYTYPNVPIQLDLALSKTELPIDTAISCGLIINELFSNAIKYAFPMRQTGRIRVEFFTDELRNCTLIIADDGVGIPETIQFQTATSLGLRLVNALMRKLRGNIQINRDQGTTIKICFAQAEAA
ncbi:MAG: PAS domain-containing protein [Elainella sp. Prado103]|nr:PAS domain-containing protein [Elainella sp. Prado103]